MNLKDFLTLALKYNILLGLFFYFLHAIYFTQKIKIEKDLNS